MLVTTGYFSLKAVVDGESYEKIYARNTVQKVPDFPDVDINSEDYQKDGYCPKGWTRNPVGVSEKYKYEYSKKRTKKDGVWGAFSLGALYANWSEDAIMYSIVPYPSTLVFHKDSSNNLTGNYTLKARIVKSKGDDIKDVTDSYSSLGLSLTVAIDGYDGQDFNPKIGCTISAISATGSNFIGIEMKKGASIVARVSVPIIVDGDNGDKGDKGDNGNDGLSTNVNLLHATALKSYGTDADKWNVRIAYKHPSKLDNAISTNRARFEELPNGLYGTNYLHVRVEKGVESKYIDLLQQSIIRNKDSRKVGKNRWYTLSFYLRGNIHIYMYSASSPNEPIINSTVYVDGKKKNIGTSAVFAFKDATSVWNYHWITFETTDTDISSQILFRLWTDDKSYPVGETYIKSDLCCAKLEDGRNATSWRNSERDARGASPEYPIWKDGAIYYSGAEGEDHYSIVEFRATEDSDPFYYNCTKSHTSKQGVNDPNTDSSQHLPYWENVTKQNLVFAGKIASDRIDTKTLAVQQMYSVGEDNSLIKCQNGLFEIFSNINNLFPSMRFGLYGYDPIKKRKVSTLQYIDEDTGRVLYDFGAKGIHFIEEADMIPIDLCEIGVATKIVPQALVSPKPTRYYQYQAGNNPQGDAAKLDGNIYNGNRLDFGLPSSSLSIIGGGAPINTYTDDFGTKTPVVISKQDINMIYYGSGSFIPNEKYYIRSVVMISKGKITSRKRAIWRESFLDE